MRGRRQPKDPAGEPTILALPKGFDTVVGPGALVLNYVVGGNGTVQSVQVGATFAGTPTGSCALEIAKEAKFPAFKRPRQQFNSLFFLRRP